MKLEAPAYEKKNIKLRNEFEEKFAARNLSTERRVDEIYEFLRNEL